MKVFEFDSSDNYLEHRSRYNKTSICGEFEGKVDIRNWYVCLLSFSNFIKIKNSTRKDTASIQRGKEERMKHQK